MSDHNDIPILSAETPEVTPVVFDGNEANYFLHVVDFYRTVIQDTLDKVAPLDLVVLLAFLQGAIEAQIPEAAGAFDEQREFFRSIYPAVLAGYKLQHPDESLQEGELLMIIPRPAEAPGVCELTDSPRIIVPGSTRVN